MRADPGEFLPNAGTFIQSLNSEMSMKGPLIYEAEFDFIPTYEISLVAGRLITVLVALITISWQSIKAARETPCSVKK